jgi:hypothetical protein
MLTPEQKAAIERLRRISSGESIKDVYGKSSPLMMLPDRRCVCSLALATFLADDEEPITHNWLRSIGFERGMQSAADNMLTLWFGKSFISIERCEKDDGSPHWQVAFSDGDVAVYLPAGLCPKTKGQLRRLIAALTTGE